ncbi:MAG: hypothetical protein HZA89_09975 [Verrucomicrobia bacterium]|nr:hypothetical protein [Verrucomicrobiota bacterium]
MHRWLRAAFIVLAGFSLAAEDNTLTVLDGTGTSVGGPFTLGATGTNNFLLLTNGGRLTNTHAFIGSNTTANGNVVVVTGTNSLWQINGSINGSNTIGHFGASNQLFILNGGAVVNSNGTIGALASASNNSVTVAGTGSQWINQGLLRVGNAGQFNQLRITDGGLVASVTARIGVSNSAISNLVEVSGAGSRWLNSGSLTLGTGGAGNQLLIAGGGFVSNGVVTVGATASASNNFISVAGSNSLWLINGSNTIGANSSFNRILVSDGAVVQNVRGYIGGNTNSFSNQVVVTGTGSRWENSGALALGNSGSGNSLEIYSGGVVTSASSVIGQTKRIGSSFSGTAFLATNSRVLVSGPGSFWDAGTNLTFDSSRSNRLEILEGGRVDSGSSFIGGSGGAAIVAGNGSVWNAGTNLTLLSSSSGNRFAVTNGGVVNSGRGSLSGNNNVVWISDPGSQWRITNDLIVAGYNNAAGTIIYASAQLVVTNGGELFTSNARIGTATSFSTPSPSFRRWTNLVFVSGSNSVWSNQTTIVMGTNSSLSVSTNRLVIENGGKVITDSLLTASYLSSIADRNEVNIQNGHLAATNAGGTGLIDLSRGSLQVSGGTLDTETLISSTVQTTNRVTVGYAGDLTNGIIRIGKSNGVWSASGSFTRVGDLTVGENAAGSLALLNAPSGFFASFIANSIYVGSSSQSLGTIQLAGSNTVMQSLGLVSVGSNGVTFGNGSLILSSGATLDAPILLGGDAGTGVISNRGGIYQFGTNAPRISAGNVFLNDGLIGYRGITNAPVTLAAIGEAGNIIRTGSASFMFTRASNAPVEQVILRTSSPEYFSTLVLRSNSALVANSVEIGPGAVLAVTNGTALITGALTNRGALGGQRGTATYQGLAVMREGASVFGTGMEHRFFGGLLIQSNQFVVAPGSIFEAQDIAVEGGGLLVAGGTLQFTNGPVSIASGVALSNGILSFRNHAAAPPALDGQFTNITYLGDTTLRLNNSTNASAGDFIFKSGNTGGFAGLRLEGGTNLWQSDSLTIGPGGSLFVTNTTAAIDIRANIMLVTNGTVTNYSSTLGLPGLDASNKSFSLWITGSNAAWDSRSTVATRVGNQTDSNTLVVSNGAFLRLSGSTYVGYGGASATNMESANNNRLAIVGTNSTLLQSGSQFALGYYSSDNLIEVRNGGRLTNTASASYIGYQASSNNVVLVSGQGSVISNGGWLYLGYYSSSNQLVVRDGGRMENQGLTFLGYETSSYNITLISGQGSTLHIGASGQLRLGDSSSSNQLVVRDGGRIENSGSSYIGFWNSTNNVALVTGRGSTFSNGGSLELGFSSLSSSNQLIVTKGGLVTAPTISLDNGDNGILKVHGGNVSAGNMTIGDFSSGQLDFQGGTITVTSNFIARGSTDAKVNFAGGILHTRDSTVDLGQTFTVGDGSRYARLNLLGGTNSYAQGVRLSLNAALTGTGLVRGSVTSAGAIRPGNSAGSLTIEGDLSLEDSASLTFEIGGLLQGANYDFLTVTNFVQFAGMLSLKLINGFNPSAADSFTLMNFAAQSGAFNNAFNGGRLLTADHLGSFLINNTGTNLTASSYQSADLDGDGIEDAWAMANFGKTPLPASAGPEDKFGDADSDGASNYAEFLAGTDPNDAASALRLLSVAPDADGNMAVQFSCVEGRNYGLFYSYDLRNWTEIVEPEFTYPSADVGQWIDDGGQTGDLLPATGSAGRFYRVTLK